MTITTVSARLTFRRRRAAALAGALPLAAVAAFQVALWLGAPYGDAVLGGRAPTVDGVLTAPYRWAALGQGGALLAMAWALLARGGLTRLPGLGDRGLRRAAWTIAAFMALNTAANLSSPHPLERWIGAATLTVALASTALASAALTNTALAATDEPSQTPAAPAG